MLFLLQKIYSLFDRSEFLIDTWYIPETKSVRVCVRLILVLVWKKIASGLVWGTSERLVPAKKKQNAWYQRALRCQLRGRPFHPWAGRLRFCGEAHPGPATLTQSSTFSCGAGLQSQSRLLLCCAPAVYMLAADAAVAAAAFGLEHLISYCNHTKRCFGPTSGGKAVACATRCQTTGLGR